MSLLHHPTEAVHQVSGTAAMFSVFVHLQHGWNDLGVRAMRPVVRLQERDLSSAMGTVHLYDAVSWPWPGVNT
jgi:hypothetical protein